MTEKPSPTPPKPNQFREDLTKSLRQAYAWLQEKRKQIIWPTPSEPTEETTQQTTTQQKTVPQKSAQIIPVKKVSSILSHWHKLFEGFQESPQNIYALLEETINKRKIPDVTISRISYPEAGALSAKREYLRVHRKDHIFDICAAPFGTGFFISWWLGEPKKFFWLPASILVISAAIVGFATKLPWWLPLGIALAIVGLWKLSMRPTYYRLDTALMFQDSVHSAVLDVIGQTTEGKGIKALSELERKPVMSKLFGHKL